MKKISEDPRFDRLPKWVQRDIVILERDRDELSKVLADDAKFTDEYNSPGMHIGNTYGQHRVLSIKEAHGTRIVHQEQAYTLHFHEDGMGIMHEDLSRGVGKRFAVMPRAANVVLITAVDR